MRQYIRLIEQVIAESNTPRIFTAYHGSKTEIDRFDLDEDRGIHFATNMDDASSDGPIIYKCRLHLMNPKIHTETEPNGDIDRPALIKLGFDGRIIRHDNGGMDVIAFYPEQITILRKMGSEDLSESTDELDGKLRALRYAAEDQDMILDMSLDEDGSIMIDLISIPLNKQGQGLGTEFMREVCFIADDANVPVKLEAQSFNQFDADEINQDDLERFYRRFGFEITGETSDGGNPIMLRHPH